MGLITDEQQEKRSSQFIKIEDKTKLRLLSNLYKTKSHFLQDQRVSVFCKNEDCYFCDRDIKSRTEYFYYASVENGNQKEEGIVRLPASVFFALNEQERVLEINKRDSFWVISKKGSGLETEYGVARGKEAGVPEIAIEEANLLLVKTVDSYVKSLEQKYSEWSKESDDDPFGGLDAMIEEKSKK